ncbi:hypothetical protein EBZ37_08910 [bacterium]|nr:hypothetical protein [bacterium]
MQASTSTSKFSSISRWGAILAAVCASLPALSYGENGPPGPPSPSSGTPPPPPASVSAPPSARANQPEDQDLKGTPYTEYGEFNEQNEEDNFTRFLQYGRFVGVSLGGGMTGATGNRGSVYQGGFPSFELKLHYWFDFDFALEMSVSTSSFYWDTQTRGHADTTVLRLGLDLKYYIPVYNLAAPVTFANPYLTFGFGGFRRSDTFQREEIVDSDSSVGLGFGGGLEFVLSPRRTYFYLAGKYHLVNFNDSYTTTYQAEGIDDLSGQFFTFTAGFLFTW